MSGQIKILFLAANPFDTDPLMLDEETRAIDKALRQTQFRDKFDFIQYWAVSVSDLQEVLLRNQPHIVHFSGHGSLKGEIILKADAWNSKSVSSRSLSQLFSILRDNIRCVVLNACYSAIQANAIAKHIDCVVGMSKAIGDESAIRFSTAFYRALGYGRDLKTAFDLGCLQIDLENLDEYDIPKLVAESVDPKFIAFKPDTVDLEYGCNKNLSEGDKLSERQQQRLLILSQVYAITGGDTYIDVSTDELIKLSQFTKIEIEQAIDFLVQEDLLDYQSLAGNFSITHKGVKKAESNLSKTDDKEIRDTIPKLAWFRFVFILSVLPERTALQIGRK